MFAYITIGSNDLARAQRFHDATLATLGASRLATSGAELGYGPTGGPPRLWLNHPFDGQPASVGNGTMPAFAAATRAAVDAFHAAALAHGGSDAGAPGLRPAYGPTFYAAYVRDPDGNKLSAVCTQPQA